MEYEKIIELLEENRCYAKEHYVPIIRDKSSKFLFDFIRENCVRTVLEIGTAIGYSGSIMLSAGVEKLTTIDINSEYLEYAKKTFERLETSKKVEIFNDDAKNVIDVLKSQGQKFDMVFLDGAKGQYYRYLPVLKDLIKEDGVIFADNVLLQGLVKSDEVIPHKKRSMVMNLRKYLQLVQNHPYSTKLYEIEDGIAITKYIGGEEC